MGLCLSGSRMRKSDKRLKGIVAFVSLVNG